jgi:hypothetical protein
VWQKVYLCWCQLTRKCENIDVKTKECLTRGQERIEMTFGKL